MPPIQTYYSVLFLPMELAGVLQTGRKAQEKDTTFHIVCNLAVDVQMVVLCPPACVSARIFGA